MTMLKVESAHMDFMQPVPELYNICTARIHSVLFLQSQEMEDIVFLKIYGEINQETRVSCPLPLVKCLCVSKSLIRY